jgi:hypothetical protein
VLHDTSLKLSWLDTVAIIYAAVRTENTNRYKVSPSSDDKPAIPLAVHYPSKFNVVYFLYETTVVGIKTELYIQ